MTNYMDLDELRDRVYSRAHSLDDRFIWRKIIPVENVECDLLSANPQLTPILLDQLGRIGIVYGPDRDPEWADGFEHYQLLGCAHLEMYRDGKLCFFCGHENPYEPPAEEAARKARGAK